MDGDRATPVSLTICCSRQVPPCALSDGAEGGDGLGVDGHNLEPVQLDLCGGHLRTHLHPEVLAGVREGRSPGKVLLSAGFS